jgi:hypothetical protein
MRDRSGYPYWPTTASNGTRRRWQAHRFDDIRGYGFGTYPFPNFTQPLLEKLDPRHAHQWRLSPKSFDLFLKWH